MLLAAASTHRSQPTFRPDLQGLRAIAVSLVVLSHAGVPWLPGGFIGVDVFFVLSGYLITGLLIREFEQTGRIDLLGFYTRRLKRLLPALALMIAFTVGLAGWLLASFEARAQLASAPYAATWTSNLYFTFTTFDYFDELASRDLFLHTWSLGVEEQFYLVWPLLLLALLLAGPAQRQIQSSRARVIVLGLVTLAGLAFSLFLSSHSPTWAFYLMPSRIWQFSFGAIVYVALARDNGTSRLPGQQTLLPSWFSQIAFYGGLLLILGSALWLHPGLAYPGPWAVFPSVGAALLIAAGQNVTTKQPDLLTHKYMVWLGDHSYSLYLWHWPLLMLGYSFGAQGKPFPIIGLVLCALLAAMFSYQFVELPFWKGRYSVASPTRALLVSVLVMLSIPALQIHMPRFLPARTAELVENERLKIDPPVIYQMGCDAGYQHARVDPCRFETEGATRKVVLLGDSIGAQWFSMVPEVFQKSDWNISVFTKSSCAIVDEDFVYDRIGGVYEICAEWRNSVLGQLELERPDVVIVGNSIAYPFDEEQWIEGGRRVFQHLSRFASHVIIIPGTPTLGFDGPGCLARNRSASDWIVAKSCVATDRNTQTATVTEYLKMASSPFQNVHMLDLNDLVCPDGECRALSQDGLMVFRDSQHLNDSFVQARAPLIRERIQNLLISSERFSEGAQTYSGFNTD